MPLSGEEAHGTYCPVGFFLGIMIRQADNEDWKLFLDLARAEGWRVPEAETRLFLGPWQHCVRVAEEGQTFCGLITMVAYQHSAWIGNLVVPKTQRGKGYGTELFLTALSELQKQAGITVWLTASDQGKKNYQKSGFVEIDKIERWVFKKRSCECKLVQPKTEANGQLMVMDAQAWGEKRETLLKSLVSNGEVVACDDAVALLQKEANCQIIGPWYCLSKTMEPNRVVLKSILERATPGIDIVVDLFQSSPVRVLLIETGFLCTGENAVMVSGPIPHIQTKMMVSLASLGSIG